MRHTNDKWPDETEAMLKQLYLEGRTYSQIGKVIGVSRCAVSGKLRRLMGAGVVPKINRDRGKPPSARSYTPRRKQLALVVEPAPQPECVPVDLMDMQSGQCRFPVTEAAPYGFCGAPSKDSWCAYHRAIVFQPKYPARAA